MSLVFVAHSAAAQDASRGGASLDNFGGRFSGGGTLKRASEQSARSLSCTFQGSPTGLRLELAGRCSAGILSTSSKIDVRLDPGSQRVTGSYRDGTGTIATLSGTRRGNAIVLAFNETAQSTNPGPPARLVIGQTASGLSLSLRSTRPDAGQNLDLTLQKQ